MLASAPGCVHLLGNGTGPMLSLAVGPRTWVAAAKRRDRRAFLRTMSAGGETALALDRLERTWEWTDPVAAVVWSLERHGLRLGGFELLASVEVPDGAGFWAGASLEVAAALALGALFGFQVPPQNLAQLCHEGQLGFIGHASSLAGPAVIAQAQHPGASFVDCVTGAHKPLSAALRGGRFLIADTGLRRPASAP
ncbi:MAG: hypothetical protein HY814_02435, partial [Candidatus Riflebacteria bacterium]|nr:hypothetical protein [Candidatus Riflebacteria bacterium]